jgi:hypothetical protein
MNSGVFNQMAKKKSIPNESINRIIKNNQLMMIGGQANSAGMYSDNTHHLMDSCKFIHKLQT